MKIIEFRAENFKRLSAVRIRPDGAVVQITGRNAQGKSSVLDAVWAALGGKDAAPSKPIRNGAEKATVFLDLGDVRVRRSFTGEGRSNLIVESAEGTRYASPQAVLDKLVGQLTFDPLAFSRMPEREQARTLRQLAGLDVSALDAERQKAFDERTAVNRDVKRLQGQLAGMPEVDAPDEEVSVVDLAAEHMAATKAKSANDDTRRKLDRIVEDGKTANAAVKAAEEALAKAKAALAAAQAAYTAQKKTVEALVDPNVDAIAARMTTAEKTNATVRAKKARAEKLKDLAIVQTASDGLTKKIDAIDARKAEALAAAKFPVPGLSVEGDTVAINGIPFDQTSSAEQIRVGLAIGAALNPKLRVVLVRDGSLLDADGLRLVGEWAEANDMQVIMERVADGTATGVVIEDGEVVGAEPETDDEKLREALADRDSTLAERERIAATEAPPTDEEFPFC